jgi:uncharacterized protein YyaL (SSP411 family)
MTEDYPYTNELIRETSPYLLQHAHNPVNWHAWNEKTLELAKKENKLLLISIGYAACHWCHVMEHESFEDSTVASIMNKNFINIKVDREERPDVDQVYMNAVQLLTGRGGWPLNCIALPDGRPVWGGTYFPKEKWTDRISKIAQIYKEDPKELEEYAEKITEGIHQSSLITVNTSEAKFTKDTLESVVRKWETSMDFTRGGRMGAPKFPMPNNLSFLLRFAVQNNNDKILNYVNTSLIQMAYGGIYDQIGGGFARYSTDNKWHIPHFEKMLYDNAQLVSLYSKAYLVNKDPLYKQVVFETTKFIEHELYNDAGAFYSSLDADSKNETGELEEGAYYVWTKRELQKITGNDFDLFSEYFNVNLNGKWEKDKYHLIRKGTDKGFAEKHQISIEDLQKKISHWKELLLTEREKRDRPGLDDKTLTSWNALMLKAYTDAYASFGEKHFLEMALKNARFIIDKQIKPDGGLYRNYKNGKSNIDAYLEDYATVINAFITLYEATFDENWLKTAKRLTNYTYDHFYDGKSKMFFFTPNANKDLISRKIDVDDNVIPSSNSIMAINLFKLGHYFENKNYSKTAEAMLNNMEENILRYPEGTSNWLMLYANYLGDFYEIAISGPKAKEKLREINQYYIPNKLLVGDVKESNLSLLKYKYSPESTTFFICIDGACKLPVDKVEDALKQINIRF